MALITLCGFPCIGKTRFAEQLRESILSHCGEARVVIINEEFLNLHKKSSYSDSFHEKSTRGILKSAVDRELSGETFVILDSLNYIKGYRYELYCIARSRRLLNCCVYINGKIDQCEEWNNLREENNRYDTNIMGELRSRFEFPNEKNRWDSPLFTVNLDNADVNIKKGSLTGSLVANPNAVNSVVTTTEVTEVKKSSWKPKPKKPLEAAQPQVVDEAVTAETSLNTVFDGLAVDVQPVPAQDTDSMLKNILSFIFSNSLIGKYNTHSNHSGGVPIKSITVRPNASTVAVPHAYASLAYDLDRVSALITDKIIAHLKMFPDFEISGMNTILFADYKRSLTLNRKIGVSEIQRHRAQFIKVNTLHPPVVQAEYACELLGGYFIDFLSTQF